MIYKKITSATEGEFFSLSVTHLRDLYVGTVEELRECADHQPTAFDETASHEARENVLHDFQDLIIKQASKVDLKSTEDVHALIDIWGQVSGVNDPEGARMTDKLILNVFRNLYTEPALKTKMFAG